MGTRAVAIVAALMVTGCGQRQESFTCTDDASCGAGGKCEPGFSLCSFANPGCSSGRSFGDLGGSSAGQCVGGGSPTDAGIDMAIDSPPDARLCFGASPFTICFTSPPMGTINVSMPTTFDTVNGTMGGGTVLNCSTSVMSGGDGYCVIAADIINVSSSLRATGTKPLVLVAATSINVPGGGSIDVGSRRLPTESTGAGANPAGAACNANLLTPGTSSGTNGGGAGGSFIGLGGNGGGGGNSGGNGGVRAPVVGGTITVLRGGCPGQDGAGANKGIHGSGGGAVFLIAGSTITVNGSINAGGEGGAGAQKSGNGADQGDGGGGGGAGGMIGVDATTIMVTGSLSANGGGGGQASGPMLDGGPGGDAISTTAAPGGTGGTQVGGDGGAGSAGLLSTSGVLGQSGSQNQGGGGGGGGGGAGLIKGPAASLGSNVSPPATP